MVPENNNKVKVPSPMRICWCGNTEFLPFNSDYGECRACRTLVFLKDMPPEQLLVLDDDNDYYGKHYWLEHQRNELGLADIILLFSSKGHWVEPTEGFSSNQ